MLLQASNSIAGRFDAAQMQPDGCDALYCISADPGFKNLVVAFGRGIDHQPEINVNWEHGALVNPETGLTPVEILAVFHINLLPEKGTRKMRVVAYQSKRMRKLVTLLKPVVQPMFAKIKHFFRTSPLGKQVMDELTNTGNTRRLFTELGFATEYDRKDESAHSLITRLTAILTSEQFMWLWMIPSSVFLAENQVDRLEEHRKRGNPFGPVIWLMANTLYSCIAIIDRLCFGKPRDFRWTAKKYGNSNAMVVRLTQELHKRMKDEYKLRKERSVVATDIVLRANGDDELRYWINHTMAIVADLKLDDVCDGIAIIFDFFNSCLRTKPYTAAERARIITFIKQRMLEGAEDSASSFEIEIIDNDTVDPYDPRKAHQILNNKPLTNKKGKSLDLIAYFGTGSTVPAKPPTINPLLAPAIRNNKNKNKKDQTAVNHKPAALPVLTPTQEQEIRELASDAFRDTFADVTDWMDNEEDAWFFDSSAPIIPANDVVVTTENTKKRKEPPPSDPTTQSPPPSKRPKLIFVDSDDDEEEPRLKTQEEEEKEAPKPAPKPKPSLPAETKIFGKVNKESYRLFKDGDGDDDRFVHFGGEWEDDTNNSGTRRTTATYNNQQQSNRKGGSGGGGGSGSYVSQTADFYLYQ